MTQKTKSSYATHICKVCFKEITPPGITDLFNNGTICRCCFNELSPDVRSELIHGYKARYLYEYKDKVKDLIYQFKGCGDIELSDVFVEKQKPLLKILYLGYTIVPAPSYTKKDEKRGFNHVREMFKPLNMKTIYALKKERDVKQADLDYVKRKEIKESIKFNDGCDIRGKRILLVDDIITSGFTAKACADLLMRNGAKTVRILAIARTKHDKTKAAYN